MVIAEPEMWLAFERRARPSKVYIPSTGEAIDIDLGRRGKALPALPEVLARAPSLAAPAELVDEILNDEHSGVPFHASPSGERLYCLVLYQIEACDDVEAFCADAGWSPEEPYPEVWLSVPT